MAFSLDSFQSTAGLLVALATSVAALWVVVARPQWVDKHHFRQARSVGTLIIAVGLVLIFVFWGRRGNLEDLRRLGYIAQIGIPVCLVAFLLNVSTQLIVANGKPGIATVLLYLLTLILYTSAGSLSLSASTVMLIVYGNPEGELAQGIEPSKSTIPVLVAATVTGQRMTEQTGQRVPFRVSSGQVNFGCGQTVSAAARITIPPQANVAEPPVASWTGLDNAKTFASSVAREGQEIVARGTITGLDSVGMPLPFGGRIENCPGAGHGEIVLTGAYIPTQREQTPFSVNLTGSIDSGPLRMTLPSASDLSLLDATISFRGLGNSDVASPLRLPLSAMGGAPVSNDAYDARLENGQIVIQMRQ